MGKGLSPRVRALVRASVADLEPYDPGFTPVRINLSANENTHGMPEEVRRSVQAALAGLSLENARYKLLGNYVADGSGSV